MTNEARGRSIPTVLSRRGLLQSAGALSVLSVAAAPARAAAAPVSSRELFVDPVKGSDTFDGLIPRPGGRHRGPVATLEKAWELAQSAAAATSVKVWLRGGTYYRDSPLVITARDTDAQIRFLAYPEEKPVISGARPIAGWQETTVNGRRAWTTVVPDVRDGKWWFRELYVNGDRRSRTRLPKAANEVLDGGKIVDDVRKYFSLFQPGSDAGGGAEDRTFVYSSQDIDPSWRNPRDIDVVSMRDWFDERVPIESVDAATKKCTAAFRSYLGRPWAGRYYYVENVYEALLEPGQWYLDRQSGELIYLPRGGESIDDTTISAPRTRQLLQFVGDAAAPAANVTFEGITFSHTDWNYWMQPTWQRGGQSAAFTEGALVFRHSRECALINCTVRMVGEYGVTIEENSSGISVVGCTIADTGAGGIRLASRTGKPGVTVAQTGNNIITDNRIHDVGRVFHMGAGILAMDTFGNTISHNEIRDLFYTGISVGWTWGFAANPTRDNLVEFNHIHGLGKGLLSDLGGIYTLGVQPGTRVSNNYIHDVLGQTSAPAAGLYADQGSAYIAWENNVVHHAGPAFNLNYGADNAVRNNIFVESRRALIRGGSGSRGGLSPYSLLINNNILVVENTPGMMGFGLAPPTVTSDNNLLWNGRGTFGDVENLVKIVRASDGKDVPGTAVSVPWTDVQPGTFGYETLAAPVTLEANTRYYIVTEVIAGGTGWYDPIPLVGTSDATIVAPVWTPSHENYTYVLDTKIGCFGPLNFRYTVPGDSQERTFAADVVPETPLKSDYSSFLGVCIEVGDTPLAVTALGRFRTPTPSWWPQWQGAGLDTHSVVATPNFVDGQSHDFRLRSTSPALGPPVSFQPIDLGAIGPR